MIITQHCRKEDEGNTSPLYDNLMVCVCVCLWAREGGGGGGELKNRTCNWNKWRLSTGEASCVCPDIKHVGERLWPFGTTVTQWRQSSYHLCWPHLWPRNGISPTHPLMCGPRHMCGHQSCSRWSQQFMKRDIHIFTVAVFTELSFLHAFFTHVYLQVWKSNIIHDFRKVLSSLNSWPVFTQTSVFLLPWGKETQPVNIWLYSHRWRCDNWNTQHKIRIMHLEVGKLNNSLRTVILRTHFMLNPKVKDEYKNTELRIICRSAYFFVGCC